MVAAMNGHEPNTFESNLNRRSLMNRSLLLGGVAAVGVMTGCSDDAEADSATDEASEGMPPGGPGGQGGPGGGDATTFDEFVGVTADGTVVEDVYAVQSTGVDTSDLIAAAQALLDGLSDEEKSATLYDLQSDQWFAWSNVDFYERNGIRLADLDEFKRTLVMAVLEAGMSADGLERSKNIMALNGWLGENSDRGQGNENLTADAYYITVIGEPSETEPWGWQFQGHHLAINYFVLGDQVVMTPTFMGSEPTSAEIDGQTVTVLDDYTSAGLELMNALDEDQRQTAVIAASKNNEDLVAGAFGDNEQVPYEGLAYGDLNTEQRELLWEIAEVFVNNLDSGHAEVRMDELREHADETYFAWIGDWETDDAAYYYRIHSPVVLIQCDCQGPLALDGDGPSQNHIHTLIRTPNGNDYGMDLLKLHLELDH